MSRVLAEINQQASKPEPRTLTQEEQRLEEARDRKVHWKRWGPYLSERQWGTVREDYSPSGTAWDYFPHDHARSRTYRWGEDGIGGISVRHQMICFAMALWNGRDPILKERLFGLTGNQGNHGEDVKEQYFYLDSTPTHSYLRMLYKYGQREYPYKWLLDENAKRGRNAPEFELLDAGHFAEHRYFDVNIEYAKCDVEDILIQITATNRGPESAGLHLLPTLWFRNTWSWGKDLRRPTARRAPDTPGSLCTEIEHWQYGKRWLLAAGTPELLFTENETNYEGLFNFRNRTPYVKDAFHAYLIHGNKAAVNPARAGTKMAAHYVMELAPGQSATLKLRLTDTDPLGGMDSDSPMVGTITGPAHHERGAGVPGTNDFAEGFEAVFETRQKEAAEFYDSRIPKELSDDARHVMRQAYSGMLWSKQFYHYDVYTWLEGDPAGPEPPPERLHGRNKEWTHLYNDDIISMPDKWEYPWYAAWDLAFHCIPLAIIDPDYAKDQLILLLREWYMHPNGQLPAYEWAFGDVNPPVHAWAAWRVYKIEKKRRGQGDRAFLERVFHKLLLNFTWWVNRKDAEGMNIFQGGFLGLDNIGVFDRSARLPTGGLLEQSDGTSWMAMYTLNLLAIALELAADESCYEDVASKFWEHFLYIANAMCHRGSDGQSLWNEEDGFFYDVLHAGNDERFPMKVRSMVGLIPLFAVETLDSELLDRMPSFKRRMEWFIENRPDLTANLACMRTLGQGERRLLSIVDAEKLRSILKYMLDENEFLSPYGIRALSRHHEANPYVLNVGGTGHRVDYEPGESRTGLFGGNSNWRGPIWFPVNFLLVEALQRFHYYLGDDFKVECPTGSGQYLTLWEVAAELSRRMSSIFTRDDDGRRPVYGDIDKFQYNENWNDLILFHEYFHGDTGAGIGASHQTGWTALVGKLMQQSGGKKSQLADAVAAVAAD